MGKEKNTTAPKEKNAKGKAEKKDNRLLKEFILNQKNQGVEKEELLKIIDEIYGG